MFKDSSLHIAARDSIAWWKAWLIRLIAVFLSLIVCAIVIFGLTKMNPVEVYKGIFDGAVGTSRRTWVTVRDTMVLLLIAIGLTPAFKMKFWNIGAEGQILLGGIAAAACMMYFDSLPNGFNAYTGTDDFDVCCQSGSRYDLGNYSGDFQSLF